VVTGKGDDPSGAAPAAEAAAVFTDQQPGCPGIDGEVTVETLNGGVEDSGTDRFAVAHHQGGNRA
jgi:hypothetical protein